MLAFNTNAHGQLTVGSYPGPTLRVLELLQQERFRKEILIPEVVDRMIREGFAASTAGPSQ